jgi:hypothetical protein
VSEPRQRDDRPSEASLLPLGTIAFPSRQPTEELGPQLRRQLIAKRTDPDEALKRIQGMTVDERLASLEDLDIGS